MARWGGRSLRACDRAIKAGPIPVAVVSCGMKHPGSTVLIERINEWRAAGNDERTHWEDVRPILNDPHDTVPRHSSIEHPQVLASVTKQSRFAEVAKELMGQLADNPVQILVVSCTGGNHRAPTLGELTASLCNMLSVAMPGGNNVRLFNAQHFRMSTAVGSGMKTLADDIFEWVERPYYVNEGIECRMENMFGFSTAKCNRQSLEAYKIIFKDVLERYQLAQWRVAAKRPKPPDTPPPQRKMPRTAERQQGEEPREQMADAATSTEPLPQWASFDATAEDWKEVLDEVGVDQWAQMELFLLSQHSRSGWEAANKVLGKLLKKMTDDELPDNVSAWTHACVLNARHRDLW